MFKKLIFGVALTSALFSCGNSDDDLANKKAIGGKRYGGEFRFMSPERVESLLSIQAVDIYTQRVTSQIFDPLLSLSADGEKVLPALAESYSVSSDGKTYSFKIRKGVKFQEDDCFDGDARELTAKDVKFTLDMACSGLKINEVSWLLVDRIVGAKDFFNATKTTFNEAGVKGIVAKDDYTLEIKLNEPFAGFDKIMTYSGFGVFPKEAYDTYGAELPKHPVGTGPFQLEEMAKDKIVLKRNGAYWKKDEFGNQLPFLAKVIMTYADDKKSELMAFRKADIDLVLEIPADEVEYVLGSLQEAQAGKTVKHKVDATQSMNITFIGLSHNNPVFKDIRVRQALNMAIDRVNLVNNQLKGEGYPVLYGMVPNCSFYDATKVKGNTYNVAKAQALLAEAGFKNGANFPIQTLYVNGKKGSDKHQMALGVAQQLKQNLNIDVTVKLVSIEERNKVVSNGTAAMWVSGWIADYPDAESFLSLFYGGNIREKSKFINPFKYKNDGFDKLLEAANREKNSDKRMDLMVKADQQLIDDAVVIPVLTDDFITMINSRVRDFSTNSLETLDLSTIFIKELKK